MKRLKELVSIIESLENFANIYPLDSDQEITLRNARNEMNLIIKEL